MRRDRLSKELSTISAIILLLSDDNHASAVGEVADHKEIDHGLDTLLELDGEVFPMDNGYWVKMEARKVDRNEHIPHGVRYSLTLHDRNNVRVLGYDNAHRVKPKRRKYGASRSTWDHKHERNRIKLYEFENTGQLLEDFWKDVDAVVK